MPIFGSVVGDLRRDAMEQMQKEIESLKRELAAAKSEIAAMRPVVEAAKPWQRLYLGWYEIRMRPALKRLLVLLEEGKEVRDAK